MHVLLIHQAFATPTQGGGTRHYELAQHLLKEGHSFTVVTGNIGYLTGTKLTEGKQLVAEDVVDGLRILRAYVYPSVHRSYIWRVVAFLSFMVTSIIAGIKAGDVDIVMGTTPPIFQAVSAWIVAMVRRRPFLLEVRDLWPEFAIGMGVLRNPVLIALSRRLESTLYWAASHILVNSPAYRDYLLAKGIDPAKITLIPNGVSPEMFDPGADAGAFRARHQVADKFVVTYSGALGQANDIPVILNAADRLRDKENIHFLLVGDGKDREALQTQTLERALSNVTFTGSVPKNEMSDVLAASDACIATLQNIPMFTTTYPNKVFDYMAAGRPTILAIDGVIREVIDACEGGLFVPPGDAPALAQAILTLASDPARGRAMGQRARNYVVLHFNRADHAHQFLQLLTRLSN